MKDEFYTKLGIFSGVLTPTEINSMLNIECEKSYIKGDQRGNTKIREKENGWIIYSNVSREQPLSTHIDDILQRVLPSIEIIYKISKYPETEVELGCVIHAQEEPPLFFTHQQVVMIAKMGASIDVDLYYWQRD